MIKNIAVGLSSGTSGNYGLFLTNPKERLIWVSYILAKMLPKPIWHKQKIALFLRADNQLYQNLGMSSRIQFKFYDTFSSIEEHIKTLNQQQPDILVAPPNVLKILALAVINKELNLHPTRVISVADVLDPQDRHFISQTFKQTVHQLYQCTEGFIASTCRYGTLHVNEDLIIMEKQWIDRKLGKFVPVITDMQRHTQPIIRYQLNDILTIKHRPCACGSKFLALKSIEGRSDDILYFNSLDKKKKIRIFPDFIRHAIMTATDRNINYKVIQNSMDHLQVAIEADDGSIQSLAVENLRNLFERYRIIQPRIELINYQSPVLYEKQRRVQRILEVPIYEQAS